MGKNRGDGSSRAGCVKDRSQTYNPKTGQFVKRGENGRFISCKKTPGPYKGVRKDTRAKAATKAKTGGKSTNRGKKKG